MVNQGTQCWLLYWQMLDKMFPIGLIKQQETYYFLTRQLKAQINLLTGCVTPALPVGMFLNVPPPLPRSDWKVENGCNPWWIDQTNCLGYLSQKTRKIRLVNTLTRDEHILEVCSEDTLSAIQERYTAINAHAKGYMWKRLSSLLDMNLTLHENGIIDEDSLFDSLGMNNEHWLPVIHLYFRYIILTIAMI